MIYTEMPKPIKNILEKKFKIIDHFSFLNFDYQFEWLRNRLSQCKKEQYDHREKIIIEHLDTDYYFKECTVGVNLRNFFEMVNGLDISPSLFVFYTNHFGLKKEIDILCENYYENDKPFIIESFIGELHYDSNKIDDIFYDFNEIKYNGLCMMNEKRSHRSALYNALKGIDSSKITIQMTNNNNAN